jgi:hypothetical protein
MAREYRIHIRGKQRAVIDADLMARLVVMLGRQLANDAMKASEAARGVSDIDGLEKADQERASSREAGERR